MYYVYILKCKGGYLYTGLTRNIIHRMSDHRDGKSVITKNRRPVELVYLEEFQDKSEAGKREKVIKGWRREKKENIIRVYGEEHHDEPR